MYEFLVNVHITTEYRQNGPTDPSSSKSDIFLGPVLFLCIRSRVKCCHGMGPAYGSNKGKLGAYLITKKGVGGHGRGGGDVMSAKTLTQGQWYKVTVEKTADKLCIQLDSDAPKCASRTVPADDFIMKDAGTVTWDKGVNIEGKNFKMEKGTQLSKVVSSTHYCGHKDGGYPYRCYTPGWIRGLSQGPWKNRCEAKCAQYSWCMAYSYDGKEHCALMSSIGSCPVGSENGGKVAKTASDLKKSGASGYSCVYMGSGGGPVVTNNGFESGSTTSGYQYTATCPGWVTTAGKVVFIKSSNGAWGGTAAGDGSYLLGLQNTNQGVSQSVAGHTVGKKYVLRFKSAKRSGYSDPTLKVSIAGKEVMSFVPSSPVFAWSEVKYTALSDKVTIKFWNGSPSGDRTAFIDKILIEADGQKVCKSKSTSTADVGYSDSYRGWYDVQGCGNCNDYCRWVGNSGSGGNPLQKTVHGSSWLHVIHVSWQSWCHKNFIPSHLSASTRVNLRVNSRLSASTRVYDCLFTSVRASARFNPLRSASHKGSRTGLNSVSP